MCMDKKYEVKVTRQAMAQMKEIVHYISAELLAPEAANKLLDKIRDAIAALSFMPKKYALIEEEPWKHEGVRKIIVKNFLIYYWVDEENFKVQVIAVIYNRRDQLRALIINQSNDDLRPTCSQFTPKRKRGCRIRVKYEMLLHKI